MLLDFESVGYDCEFGLVQRYWGLEPLGLFRFTSAPINELIAALDTDFIEYGADGDLSIFEGPQDHLFCRSTRYGFSYNTCCLASQTEPRAIIGREYKKVRYLKQRFLEDLASGQKIFVRNEVGDADEIENLARALRRHGPATLLSIVAPTDGRRAGDVGWRADGLIEATIDTAVLFRRSGSVPLEDWLTVCGRAHALVHGRDAEPEPADDAEATCEPFDREGRDRSDPSIHLLSSDDDVLASASARKLQSGEMYAFSAWIWLPADFAGTRVAIDFLPVRYGYYDADLTKRECWQRIWASCKPRVQDTEVQIRLIGRGPPNARFWSADWRLEARPYPMGRPAPAPLVERHPDASGDRVEVA